MRGLIIWGSLVSLKVRLSHAFEGGRLLIWLKIHYFL